MTVHTAEIRIDAPKEAVWEHLADFGGVWKFSPTVTKSHSTTEANQGVGAQRHCELSFAGASVDERVIEWSDSSYAIEIFDGEKMPPIKNIIARLSVTEDGAGSIVSGIMTYDPKGPFGWVMDRLVVRKKFGRAWAGIFAGLKFHIETGQIVERGLNLPYQQVQLATA